MAKIGLKSCFRYIPIFTLKQSITEMQRDLLKRFVILTDLVTNQSWINTNLRMSEMSGSHLFLQWAL